MKTKKHIYASKGIHLFLLTFISVNAICLICGNNTATELFKSALLLGIILRCAWDYLFVVKTVIVVTAKHILKNLKRRVVRHG